MKSFTIPVTPEQLEAARARLKAEKGIELTGDYWKGEVDSPIGKIGLELNYEDGMLTVDVLHKPMLVSLDKIKRKLSESLLLT